MARTPTMQRCFNCGAELGVFIAVDPLDHCGAPACAREARDCLQEQREEAHARLDRDLGYD